MRAASLSSSLSFGVVMESSGFTCLHGIRNNEERKPEIQNELDNLALSWLNVVAVKTLSRMMLVVVLLLLPVFLTGASLEVPGVGCNALNCCALTHCHAGDSHVRHENCAMEHCHHHHSHERILLLVDAGLREYGHVAALLPVADFVPGTGVPACCKRAFVLAVYPEVPPYAGHIAPLRC